MNICPAQKFHLIMKWKVIEYYPCNIYIIENFLNDEECNYFINFIERFKHLSVKWEINSTNNVECYNLVMDDLKQKLNNNDVIIDILRMDETIYNVFSNALNIINSLAPYLRYEKDCGYQLRKIYGKTALHTDSVHCNQNALKNYIRTLTMILNLNDNYTGGVYKFPLQNIEIELKKGSVIIFPPYWTHPHEVTSINENESRYTINTWILEKLKF
jgi:hypothetical protein